MSTSPTSRKDDMPTEPEQSPVVLLLGTLADTTWRMFTPSLIGIVGGYALDDALGTKPWLFIVGTILGCAGAGLLIKQQLKKKI